MLLQDPQERLGMEAIHPDKNRQDVSATRDWRMAKQVAGSRLDHGQSSARSTSPA